VLINRIIPILLLKDESLIKTVQFNKYQYIGDPANTCRIFNELEVDELCFLDIFATQENRSPNMKVLREISNECFMPLSYGGGVNSLKHAEEIYKTGFEKIVFNTASFENQGMIREVSRIFGAQAVVVAIDVKKSIWGNYQVFARHGTQNKHIAPIDWVRQVEEIGAGEILLTSIDREGTWQGFDLDLVKSITEITSLPVVAHGGAGTPEHINTAIVEAKASAVALGSMVVFQKKGMGVLVNFPDRSKLLV
jgi:imidazole glycerol-phosphate synthase subunit HisF